MQKFSSRNTTNLSFLLSTLCLFFIIPIVDAFEFTLPLEILRNEISIGVVDIRSVFEAVAREERNVLMKQKEEIISSLSNIEKEIENIENEKKEIDRTLETIEEEMSELARKKENLSVKLSSTPIEAFSATSVSTPEGALLEKELEDELQKIETAMMQKQQEKKELTSKKEEKEQLARQKRQEMQAKKKEEEEKLLQKEKEMAEKIYERIYSKIVELAKQENVDIIVDKNLLLYNERVKDLTNILINMLMLK